MITLPTLECQDGQLYYLADFICDQQQLELYQRLTQTLGWQQDQIKIFGRTVAIPRLQAWYGDPEALYRYSGTTMIPHSWTEDLALLKSQVEQVCQSRFNSVLANWYRNGLDKMGYHSDNEQEMGPQPIIASVSLGCARKFVLKHKHDPEKITVDLAGGSLLVMAGDTQQYYKHAIMAQKKVTTGRINLTFRFTYPRKRL